MLVQLPWVLNLLLITPATAHAGRRMGVKPRDLATGTGSLPSSISPPYPTGTANGTTNGTATPTGSIATSTATSTPVSPSEFFLLVVASTGTPYDGQYLVREGYRAYTGAIVLYPEVYVPGDEDNAQARFSLLADGALYNQQAQGVAGIAPAVSSGSLNFYAEDAYEPDPPFSQLQKSICEIVGGTVTCQTGPATVFYICPFQPEGGIDGEVLVGPSAEPGCNAISLLAVPV